MSETSYFRPDSTSLVAIDKYPSDAHTTRHAFVSASGHGATSNEALDALVVRLRQLADLIEQRPRDSAGPRAEFPDA